MGNEKKTSKKINKIVKEKKSKKKKIEVGTDEFFDEWINVACDFFIKYGLTEEQAIILLEDLTESLKQIQDK
jgi:hypothetical protein